MQAAFACRVSMIALAAAAQSCSSTPTKAILGVTAGLEGNPFDGTPAIARVELHTRDASGTEQIVASAQPSDQGIDIPTTVSGGSGALVLALVGYGADGSALVYGRTPTFDRAALLTTGLSEQLLVQRTNVAARVLSLPAAPTTPIVSRLGVGYVVLADGANGNVTILDLLQVSTATQSGVFGRSPTAVMSAGGYTFALAADASATLSDLNHQTQTVVTEPTGLSFKDVLGGSVLVENDASAAYLVGSARATGAPTNAILRLGKDGTLSARTLQHARIGAAVTLVSGLGIVVVGGSCASGDTCVPEIVGSTSGSALAYPADAAQGSLIAPMGAATALHVRPDGTAEKLDLACSSACAPSPVTLTPKLGAVTPRAGDVMVALDGNQVGAVRGGEIVRIDPIKGTVDVLAPAPSGVRTGILTDTGALLVFDAGDTTVRSVRAK